MPSIVSLPTRSNTILYDEDDVQEVYDLLMSDEIEDGQGVIVDDEAQETEGKARNRARIMSDELAKIDGIKRRTHTTGDDENGWFPVVSNKPARAPKGSK